MADQVESSRVELNRVELERLVVGSRIFLETLRRYGADSLWFSQDTLEIAFRDNPPLHALLMASPARSKWTYDGVAQVRWESSSYEGTTSVTITANAPKKKEEEEKKEEKEEQKEEEVPF